MNAPSRPIVLFMYLGRQGALGRFALELARAARDQDDIDARFLVSANNETVSELRRDVPDLKTIATFNRADPASLVLKYPRAATAFGGVLDEIKPRAVVNLMPHVWTPLLSAAAVRRGVRFVPIIHDAVPHPGDATARVTRWLLRDMRRASRVLTLSDSVAQSIVAQGYAEPARVTALFHPDLNFGGPVQARSWSPAQRPLRLLFLGRIMAYKGLDLLVEAVERLKSTGLAVELGVAGSGTISLETRSALQRLGAEVTNRWITDSEIAGLLGRYDAVVCAHIEASQSGVAAAAFGAAQPVIAFPTGGIAEQVREGVTGIVASEVSADGLAVAIARLARDPQLYQSISNNLMATAPERSMARFLKLSSQAALS